MLISLKSLISMIFLLALSASAAMAGQDDKAGHEHGHHGEQGEHREHKKHHHGKQQGKSWLENYLDLTDAQKAEHQEIRDRYARVLKDLHKQEFGLKRELMKLDPEGPDYESKVRALAEQSSENAGQKFLVQAKKHAAVMSLLTEEQKQALKAHHKKMLKHKRKHKAEDK